MNHSLGDLVDRLTVTNLKLWFVQDKIHRAAETGQGVDAETVGRQVDLNFERNELMTEIDRVLDRAAHEGRAKITARPKL